jgi:uncharacterized iron-regulated protein
MRLTALFLALISFIVSTSFTEPIAFKIYNKEGKEVSWKEVMNYCKKQQVIFFGEHHDNPISHWLQLKITKELHAHNNNLILGAEMFESDQQLILDEYLSKKISDRNFEAEMRLWKNHKTDYKPMLDYAMLHQLKFIATNVPRRYASMVSRKSQTELLTLSDDAKKFICPIPYVVDTTLIGYKNMMQMGMGHGNSYYMVQAQAIKDATMAHFISKNITAKGLFLHFNGSYHSDNFEGILYYLKQYYPSATTATFSTVTQNNVTSLDKEHLNKADFILVVDDEMTRTH